MALAYELGTGGFGEQVGVDYAKGSRTRQSIPAISWPFSLVRCRCEGIVGVGSLQRWSKFRLKIETTYGHVSSFVTDTSQRRCHGPVSRMRRCTRQFLTPPRRRPPHRPLLDPHPPPNFRPVMGYKNSAAGSGPTSASAVVVTGVSSTPTTPAVPITKRHRPWKAPRPTARSAMRNTGLKTTWAQKMAKKDARAGLMTVVRAAREEDEAAKKAERTRRYEKRKRKEENELRSSTKATITNAKKLKKMTKKQFLANVKK